MKNHFVNCSVGDIRVKFNAILQWRKKEETKMIFKKVNKMNNAKKYPLLLNFLSFFRDRLTVSLLIIFVMGSRLVVKLSLILNYKQVRASLFIFLYSCQTFNIHIIPRVNHTTWSLIWIAVASVLLIWRLKITVHIMSFSAKVIFC